MQRENGYYWSVFLPEINDPEWMPAQYFEGNWFIIGACGPVNECDLMIGPRIDINCAHPSQDDLQRHLLSIADTAGTA